MTTETGAKEQPADDPLDLAGALADDEAMHPERAVNEEQILARVRNKLFAAIDDYSPKEVLQIYLASARLEEARLKVAARGKDRDLGTSELRAKAARAIRGGGGALAEGEEDPDD